MFKNTFLTSFRALWNSKSTFFLNILGLSIGICACILAYLHVDYELSYDTHYSRKSQLHRVVVGNMETGEGWVKVSAPVPPMLKKDIPEIEAFARLTEYSYNKKVAVNYGDVVFNEPQVFLADPAIFEMMDIEFIQGGVSSEVPKKSMFISETIANKLFKDVNPIGEVLTVNGDADYTIKGVFKPLPVNSHLEMDYIVPFSNLEDVLAYTSLTSNWGQFNYFAYVQLTPSANFFEVVNKIKSTVVEFGDDQEMRFEELTLQPIEDIHFQASDGNVKASYDTRYLFIYVSIALAIFIISVINFLNLSIASSTKRIKEVGIRKVMGASRKQIVGQFVVEGLILSTVSILFGIMLSESALPFINNLVGSQSSLDLTDPLLMSMLVGLVFFIAFIAGLYITFFVISFHPITALKGAIKMGSKGNGFKNGLLIAQFVMSSVLIISSVLIYKQLNYLQTTELGLDEEQVLTIELFDEKSRTKMKALASELEQIPGVISTGASRFTPGSPNWNQTVSWPGQKENVNWHIIEVGPGFLETYGVSLAAGDIQAVNAQIETASYVYLVNEAAVESAQFEEPLGQVIAAHGSQSNAPIQGVVKDFHYQSLHSYIEPMVMRVLDDSRHNMLSLKLSSNDYTRLLNDIKEAHAEVLGNVPFEYAFADDQFEELYKVEEQTTQLIGLLTGVAVMLAILGMYALLSFAVKERTKEIAIRKVLGIRLYGTLFLLSSKYLKLLMVSNVVGLAVTWYLIDQWLANFSYHIPLNIFNMALISLSTFMIVIGVVCSKAFQTERINPTDALRNE
ncbi:MAG: ABC transporter permease [Ekhidna sp.]